MKKRYLKADWLIPSLGIVVVVVGVVAAVSYVDLERRTYSAEALSARLDNLYLDHRLSVALKNIHDGDVSGAAQRLDLLLCCNILQLNAELASADNQTRTYVEDAFRRIGRVRPSTPTATASDSGRQPATDQAAAERVLALAMAGEHPNKP